MTDTVAPAGAARIWLGGLSVSAALALVAVMARAHREPLEPGRIDPAVWWYLSRASGLIAWGLLGTSVLSGMVIAARLSDRRGWFQGLHEFVGLLGVLFTAVHLGSVLVSDEVQVGWLHLVVPFTRSAAPLAQACGVLACYLLLTVAVTSALRTAIPWRWWRRLHLLSFPLFALASTHTVLAGSDTSQPVLHWAGLAAGAAGLFLVSFRLLTLRPAPRPVAAAPPVPAAVDPGPSLRVRQTRWEADGVLSMQLADPAGRPLPRWEPGAHVELVLPSGRVRHYSLCGDPADRHHYRIAVLHAREGRGGSRELHTGIPAGIVLPVRGPRNHFPLVERRSYLFIAGGIGITAILSMARQVSQAACNWSLLYCGRSRASMALLGEVEALDPDRVQIVAEDEDGRPDLAAVISEQDPGTAVYCCGPEGLIQAVEAHTTARPELSYHCERFAPAETGGGAAFRVTLARSGRTVDVPADRSILQAVREVAPGVAASCEQGVCGACRVRVLGGEPDHRDTLLSSAERSAGQVLICVSRATTDELVLDL